MAQVKRRDTYSFMHDILRSAIRDNPQGSELEVRERVWYAVKSDPEVFRLLFDNWFNANWSQYEVVQQPGSTAILRRSRRSRQSFQEAKEKLVEVAKARVIQAAPTILLNLTLPTGKALRDATFAECRQAGGFFAAIGRVRKAGVVGKHLTEKDLANIFKRSHT
jgi:hypothetical protein